MSWNRTDIIIDFRKIKKKIFGVFGLIIKITMVTVQARTNPLLITVENAGKSQKRIRPTRLAESDFKCGCRL